jgi:hypothetical protein
MLPSSKGSLELSQCALIDTIINDAKLDDAKVKRVPAKVKENLHSHLDKPPYALEMSYRSAIGKLNYVSQTSRPEIMHSA